MVPDLQKHTDRWMSRCRNRSFQLSGSSKKDMHRSMIRYGHTTREEMSSWPNVEFRQCFLPNINLDVRFNRRRWERDIRRAEGSEEGMKCEALLVSTLFQEQ